jgi:hypothetical protein
MKRHAESTLALPPDESTDGIEKRVVGRRGFRTGAAGQKEQSL